MCHPHFSPRLCPFQTNHPTTACVSPLPAIQHPGGSGGRRLDMPQPETDAADRAYPSLQPWLLLLLTSRSEVHGEAGSAHWWRDACDRWQKVDMPALCSAELWKKSGRWELMGKEMFRLLDRHNAEYCLGPTHEEAVTDFCFPEISYKKLPLLLYQVSSLMLFFLK